MTDGIMIVGVDCRAERTYAEESIISRGEETCKVENKT